MVIMHLPTGLSTEYFHRLAPDVKITEHFFRNLIVVLWDVFHSLLTEIMAVSHLGP